VVKDEPTCLPCIPSGRRQAGKSRLKNDLLKRSGAGGDLKKRLTIFVDTFSHSAYMGI